MAVVLRRCLALAAVLGVALTPSLASAYCFTTTCKDIDACDGEEIPGCPSLRWASGCTGFSVQERGGSGLSADTVNEITRLAFDAWRGADCGGGERPGLVVTDLGEVSCDLVEYNKDAGNANIIVFNDAWPYSDATHTYALTTTTFDPDTGELLNADIELNTRDHDFTVNDESIEADLLSVLTHETGHFLGMAHSPDSRATMYASYKQGSTTMRYLATDDVAGICTAYPPDGTRGTSLGSVKAEACDPTPRHGYASECIPTAQTKSCGVAPPGESDRTPLLVLAPVAIALGRRLRRSRR